MKTNSSKNSTTELAGSVLWYGAVLWLALLLILSCCRCCCCDGGEFAAEEMDVGDSERPCVEYYVVGKGETLQSIVGKCGDPYVVERNPHILDPDDVFPGLVIKIGPF